MANKHTTRRCWLAHCCMPMDLEISDVVRFERTHEDGSKEIAISSVDLILGDTDSFIQYKPSASHCRYVGNYRCGNLNKNKLWERFVDELESTCITKTERPHKLHEKMETVYTVPVIGHKLFLPRVQNEEFEMGDYREMRKPVEDSFCSAVTKATVKKIKMNPSQFMFWEGKYYDVTKVYQYKIELSNYLQPVGCLAAPVSTILSSANSANCIAELTQNVTYHDSQHHRVHQQCRLKHKENCNMYNNIGVQYGGWTQSGANDYLEINLGSPRLVTHVGTAGEFPATQVFPTRDIVGSSRLRRYREAREGEVAQLSTGKGVKLRKFAQYVRVMCGDEHALSWVTSYEVHYRHTVTNKWVLLAVTSANTDAFSEHVLDLSPYFNAKDGLLTQYLRIKPVAYHKKPCMRIAVYGVDAINAVSALDTNESEDSLVSGSSSEDVPTITYAIIQSSPKAGPTYVHDGLRAFYCTDRNYGNNRSDPRARSTKRFNFQRMLKEPNVGQCGGDIRTDYMHGIDYKNS